MRPPSARCHGDELPAIAQGLDPDKGFGVGGRGRMVGAGDPETLRGRALELGEKLEGAQAGDEAVAGLMLARLGVGLVGQRRPVQSLAGPSSSPSVAPAAALRCPGSAGCVRTSRSAPLPPKGHRPQGPSWPGREPKLVCRAAASALGLASRTVDSCCQGCPPPEARRWGLP